MSLWELNRTVFALTFAVMPLLAQSERGTIAGSVVDPSGAAVPAAKIAVTNRGTNVAQNA